MLRATAVLLAATLLGLPASAEQTTEPSGVRPQDIAEIDGCLAAAAETGEQPEARCIGILSGPCMEAPGGETTVGMMNCLVRETAAWDAILNDQWPKLMTQAKEADAGEGADPRRGSEAETLRAAQRAWAAFRDAECTHAYTTGGDGSIRTLLGARCLLDMTAERVADFHRRLTELASR